MSLSEPIVVLLPSANTRNVAVVLFYSGFCWHDLLYNVLGATGKRRCKSPIPRGGPGNSDHVLRWIA